MKKLKKKIQRGKKQANVEMVRKSNVMAVNSVDYSG